MGIKDVFDRIKGKSDGKSENDSADDDLSRRQTNEETIAVNAAPAASGPGPESQESATVVAPSVADTSGGQEPATVVANPSPPPVPRNPGLTPRAPVGSPPSVRPSVTPVAPSSDRVPIPKPASAPSPQPAAASPSPGASVSSDEDTVYQKPEENNSLEFAAVLVGIYGDAKHEIFRLPFGSCTIGRGDDCEVQLLDPKVSRAHASAVCADGRMEITALNERNPVLVNDEPIAGAHTLADGDKIQFGNAGASVLRLRTVAALE